jgi:hypothetical protein
VELQGFLSPHSFCRSIELLVNTAAGGLIRAGPQSVIDMLEAGREANMPASSGFERRKQCNAD